MQRHAVSDVIRGALGERLEDLERQLPNFHVARTQGTLTRADLGSTGNNRDWDNEIHPNRVGSGRSRACWPSRSRR